MEKKYNNRFANFITKFEKRQKKLEALKQKQFENYFVLVACLITKGWNSFKNFWQEDIKDTSYFVDLMNESINNSKSFISDITTFDINDLTDFIVGTLNLIEGQEYKFKDVYFIPEYAKEEKYPSLVIPIKFREILPLNEIDNKEEIDENDLNSKTSLFLRYGKGEYKIFDIESHQISRELISKYPYLEYVMHGLLDLRMFVGVIDKQELLDKMLVNMASDPTYIDKIEEYMKSLEENKEFTRQSH